MTERRGVVEWSGSCYGLDVQAGKPVIVRAEKSRGRVNCFSVSQGDPAFLSAVRNRKAIISACLSPGESLSCWLEAPFVSRQKTLKVLPTLLDVQLPFALEDCVYDFVEVCPKMPGKDSLESSDQGAGTRAIAVAARVTDVEKKIENLKALGLEPVVLDHEGIAIWSHSLIEAPVAGNIVNRPRVVVYLGVERSTMVVGRGGTFVSAHSIGQNGAAQINRLLKAQIKAATGKSELSVDWIWVGPGAADDSVVAQYRRELEPEWPGKSVVVGNPAEFLARAVAARAITSGPMRCNLRSGPLEHSMITGRFEKQGLATALTYLAAGLLLCAVNITWLGVIQHRESALDAETGALADRLAGYHVAAKGEGRIKLVRDTLSQNKRALAPFVRPFEPSLVETIESMTGIARKNDVRYETFSLGRERMNITGTAGSWKSCDVLLDAVKQKGYTAKLDRKESLSDERIVFSINPAGGADE